MQHFQHHQLVGPGLLGAGLDVGAVDIVNLGVGRSYRDRPGFRHRDHRDHH